MTNTADTDRRPCTRCGASVKLMQSGDWSTGYPSHLAKTCDGVHLHRVEGDER